MTAAQQEANGSSPGDTSGTAKAIAGRILLVDDVLDNRVVLKRRLERRGYQVIEADCGEAALRLIAEDQFDLVLLDVMMPNISGVEVLQEVRKTLSSQQLPIIMVTAKCMSDDISGALQSGADDYVTKPIDFNVALARIVVQIDRKRAADALKQRLDESTTALEAADQQISKEVEQHQQTAQRAGFLARHDPLTKLPNRAAFLEALQGLAEARGQGGSSYDVLFIDLDRFKIVNDTFGHAVGDKLLQVLAQTLQATLSPGDTLARFGGDEFLVSHLTGPDSDATENLASRIVQRLAKPFIVDGHELAVGVSIGIASSGEQNESPETTISHADIAMYRAKKDGGDRFRWFDPELALAARRRSELERDLRLALKSGQLHLVYQPIVELPHQGIRGFEALLRWNHPTRGSISPAEFIPIAEETGIITQIGEWVLRTACMTAAKWPAPVKVAVNLSTVQFDRSPLVPIVVSALAASGLPPERLELEITESLMLLNSDRTLEILRRLREIGVRIVVDDFGTGYSSLGYLRDFQIDKIKVDQSFVRALATDKSSRAVVDSIVSLARMLDIQTTAEGVETQEKLSLVLTNGIGQVQGFFFGRPLAEADVAQAIADYKPTASEPVRNRSVVPLGAAEKVSEAARTCSDRLVEWESNARAEAPAAPAQHHCERRAS